MSRACNGAVALLAGLLLLVACADEEDPIASDGVEAEYPEWVEKVYPAPGAETSATPAVEVNHNVVTSEREVRLSIDGVDVTTYADQHSPSLLEYDPGDIESNPPLELEPGEHEATLELLDVRPATEGDGTEYEVLDTLDTFTWTFTIL